MENNRLRGGKGEVMLVSLCVGHGGVLDEGEVVGDVLVVGQPAVSPDQAVLAYCHLRIANRMRKFFSWDCTLVPKVVSHHGVGAPLRDEGVGLILRNHSFDQRHSVADALPHFHKRRVSPANPPKNQEVVSCVWLSD